MQYNLLYSKKIPGARNTADMGTKAINGEAMRFYLEELGFRTDIRVISCGSKANPQTKPNAHVHVGKTMNRFWHQKAMKTRFVVES